MFRDIFTSIKVRFPFIYENSVKKTAEAIKYQLGECCIEDPSVTIDQALDKINELETSLNLTENIDFPSPHKIAVFRSAIQRVYEEVDPTQPLIDFLGPEYLNRKP
jgi:hypothetical protein